MSRFRAEWGFVSDFFFFLFFDATSGGASEGFSTAGIVGICSDNSAKACKRDGGGEGVGSGGGGGMKAAGRSPSAAAAVAKGSAATGGDIERHETGSALADDRRRRRWMNASLLPSLPFVLRFYCLASPICWCSCEDTFAACLILLPPRHLARQPLVVDTKSLFIPEAKPYLKAPKRHVFFHRDKF